MIRYILFSFFFMSSVALFAQLSLSGTTVGAPIAIFPNLGSTPAACVLSGANEPYRTFSFQTSNTTTVTVNFTNIIDGGGTDDTGFSWYLGAFTAANSCTNLISVGDNFSGTNKTINVTANTNYTFVVNGIFGTQDAFAFTLTPAGGTISSVVLPVELLSFEGKNREGSNWLTWITAHEQNNKGFQVERLHVQTWETLSFVAANNKASTYEFTDNAPLSAGSSLNSTSYYRLRQIDNDGKETFSKVISISNKGNNKLKVYPNPVSNLLTIEYTEGGDFQILNLLGQQVLNGQAAQRIDVSALPQGSYFLKVGAEQVKFVKQ